MRNGNTSVDQVLIAEVTPRDEPMAANDGKQFGGRELADVLRKSADLRVDQIELCIADSPSELAFLHEVSKEFSDSGPTIAAVVPTLGPPDALGRVGKALSPALSPRLHLQTSANDMLAEQGRLRAPLAKLLEEGRDALDTALESVPNVEFSPPRTIAAGVDIAAEWTEMAVARGVTAVNVRTTAEYADPERFQEYLSDLIRLAPGIRSVTISVDILIPDLRGKAAEKVALACAEASLDQGARQVKCSIATPGHVPLEQLAFNLWARGQLGETDLWSALDLSKLPALREAVTATRIG
jgi:isopropylmalate/homocitrate/citramalate synthase